MRTDSAAVDLGRTLFQGSSGKWAGEQFLKALHENREITTADLRTLETLSRDVWVEFDNELIAGALTRLRGVADLYARNLVKRITNGLGKTVLEYQTVGDMDDAIVSMDGVTRSENDRIEFDLAGLPLPITHKDFYINLRALIASRTRGEAIDTTHINAAGRKCGEMAEQMLFQGGKQFGGRVIYGLTTHPSRNTSGFGTNGNWAQTAKTGENIIADIATLVGLLQADGFYGPYWLYTGSGASLKLSEDYKANSDRTIRERIMDMEEIELIRVVDKMPANAVVLFQPTSDVIQMVEGEPLQTVQWDIAGGFQINFKAFQIIVPLIRANSAGGSGVAHMS